MSELISAAGKKALALLPLCGVTPTMFGAVGDGITDDTTAMQTWAASVFAKIGEPKRFKVTGQVTFAANAGRVQGRGMVIDASAGGTFTNSAVMYCAGSLSALPALSANVLKGANALTFTTAHGLALNDTFLIYNPANGSFSAARTYYRAGEFVRVNFAPTETTVKAWAPFYAAYTSGAVTLHKLAANEVAISDVTIVAPGAGSIRPLKLSLATRVRLDGVQCSGSDYVGIELDRCNDVEVTGSAQFEQPQVYADEYGISIGNSQDVRIVGGMYHAGRHAVAIGGDDFTGCVPNRNIRIIGATLKNDPASNAPAADVHGNAEDVEYHNCTIYGGGSFGGLDNAYLNCTLIEAALGAGALIVGGSECMGGVYRVENCRFKSTPAFAYGIVRGYNGAAATVADSTLIVKNCTVDMGACDTFARFDMGSAAFKANAHIEGITFTGSASLANVCRMVGTGAAGDGDFVIVDGITNGKSGSALYVAAGGYGATVKARLMRQQGSVAVVPVAGANFASSSVSFRYSYGSKTPTVQATCDAHKVNALSVAVAFRLRTEAGFTADLFTCSAASFGAAAPTVNVDWLAGVSDV